MIVAFEASQMLLIIYYISCIKPCAWQQYKQCPRYFSNGIFGVGPLTINNTSRYFPFDISVIVVFN